MGAEQNVSNGSSDFAAETDRQVIASVQALRAIREIRPAIWESLPLTDRLAVLQQIEDTMALIQRRPSVNIIVDEAMASGAFGGFDGERITINGRHFRGDVPVADRVDTVIHEGRHVYQQYAVEHPGFLVDPAVTAAWAANFDAYLDAETYGQELYESQPIETDAWSYAAPICVPLYHEPREDRHGPSRVDPPTCAPVGTLRVCCRNHQRTAPPEQPGDPGGVPRLAVIGQTARTLC